MILRLVLAVLATWRVTHLLASEDGPADIIVRFRALFGQSVAGKLMDCFNCLSLWIALQRPFKGFQNLNREIRRRVICRKAFACFGRRETVGTR